MAVTDPQNDLIAQLYIENFDHLYTYAQYLLREPSLAREAVQETFCIACRKPNDMLKSPNPQGWLVNTLKNVIHNINRKQTRLAHLITMVILTQQADSYITRNEENVELLYGDIVERPEFQLLKKLAIDHYSVRELAEELGISIAACNKRVQRARKSLQKEFIKYQK